MLPVSERYICRSCVQLLSKERRRLQLPAQRYYTTSASPLPKDLPSALVAVSRRSRRTRYETPKQARYATSSSATSSAKVRVTDVTAPHEELGGKPFPRTQSPEDAVSEALKPGTVPSDAEVVGALKTIENAVLNMYGHDAGNRSSAESKDSPTSALLSLRSKSSDPQKPITPSTPSDNEISRISTLAYKFVRDPRVFISSEALDIYVTLQTMLSRPETFPEIFSFYANKPQPVPSKSQGNISYEAPKPGAASSAIPTEAADLALDAAVRARNMSLAVSIIDESYNRPAFRKAKFVKKALLPLSLVGLTPLAAWVTASQMSGIQTGMPEESFTQIAFAGMFTYAAAVGTIGYVALTSANDQFKRVSWAVGMPLWERWAREEERAALDRVACAWGFQQKSRWGEEEGRDWQDLKDWVGLRGMVLDKVGLMEGMQ